LSGNRIKKRNDRRDATEMNIIMVIRMKQLAIPLVILISSFALSQSSAAHRSGDAKTSDPGWPDLMANMEKMQIAMASVQPSGDGDVDFVKLMLPHHQAAIDMARTQLLHGRDPQMRRLAQEIITDQQSEIELMQLWLKQHSTSPQSKPEAAIQEQ
jgi:hypothetical protein